MTLPTETLRGKEEWEDVNYIVWQTLNSLWGFSLQLGTSTLLTNLEPAKITSTPYNTGGKMAAHNFHNQYWSSSFSSSKSDRTKQGTHPMRTESLHTKTPLPAVCSHVKQRADSLWVNTPDPLTLQAPLRTRTLRSGWHIRGTAAMDGVRLSHTGCSVGRELTVSTLKISPSTPALGWFAPVPQPQRVSVTSTATVTLGSSINTWRAFPCAVPG